MRWLVPVLVVLTGCSQFAVRRPPVGHPCSDEYTAPIIDTVATVVAAGAGALALDSSRAAIEPVKPFATAGGVIFVVAAAAYGASAIYGYVKVTGCRRHVVQLPPAQ